MGFTTVIYLFYFLPLFLIIFFSLPRRFKFPFLLAASFIFYIWGSPVGAVVLFLSSILDYWFGRAIDHAPSARSRKAWMAASVTFNIAILLYFKYANFFVGEFNRLLTSFGFSAIGWTNVFFPVGISFLTFQKITYLVDIYYKKAAPAPRFWRYLLYVAMFPKLTNGPIAKYRDMAGQLDEPRYTLDDIFEGSVRFCIGMAKKLLLADPIGNVANRVYGLDQTHLTPGYAWLGAVAFSFQVYLDFAAYTDMAVGVGRMMGFTLPENFRRPYFCRNFTEHWRRWHISLVQWYREYLYFPLGGNRKGRLRTYMNLWIVFLVTGFWHGANWTYLAWGAYNGFFIFLERLFWNEKITKRLPIWVNVPLSYFLIIAGQVFFRSESVSAALRHLHLMFNFTLIGKMESPTLWANLIGNRELFVLFICVVVSFFPDQIIDWIRNRVEPRIRPSLIIGMKIAVASVLFCLSLMALVNSGFSPFIYFRF